MSDVFYEFTKEEIIDYLNSKGFFYYNKVRKQDLLFTRWQIESKKLLNESEKLSFELKEINLKERDRLAKLFNESNNLNEKIRIAEKMRLYEEKLKKWWKKEQNLRIKEEKLNDLFKLINKPEPPKEDV